MAYFELHSPVVTALQERLEADLAGVIDEINADVTDGMTIDYPAQVLDYVPLPSQLTEFPTVAIGDLPARFADDTGFHVTGHYGLAVTVILVNADQRALAWQLRRYLSAIVTVALDGRRLGDAMGTSLRGITPGPTLDAVENPRGWITWAQVDINVLRSDDA